MIATLGNRVIGKAYPLSIAAVALALSLSQIVYAVEPDIPRIQAEAERGSVQQEIAMAKAYLLGHGVQRDEKLAAYWYEKAANSGDPGAQEQIGFLYQAGIGVEQNLVRGAEWFERAIAGGSTSAKVSLGFAYAWGLGVRKDPEFGFQLFREAAERRNAAGACYLGFSYYFGIGVTRDVVKARHWFEVGAKLRNPQAEFELALLLFQQADGGATGRALKLLRESAESGYVPAKHQLALLMIRDSNFPSSTSAKEAVGLMEEASSEGFWKSTTVLGTLYRDGRGKPKDKEAAYYHFRIAILQGGQNAAGLLANDIQALRSELDESKTRALDSMAVSWVQEHRHALECLQTPSGKTGNFPALTIMYAGKVYPLSEYDGGVGTDKSFLP